MPNVFLYGPDTFRKRTFDRIGGCSVLGAAKLDGYALTFNKPNMKNRQEGLPNLMAEEGAITHGVVFELEDKQVENLDGYFGGYQKQNLQVYLRKTHENIEVFSYFARRTKASLKASPEIRTLCIQGAEENGLPKDFVETLMQIQTTE